MLTRDWTSDSKLDRFLLASHKQDLQHNLLHSLEFILKQKSFKKNYFKELFENIQ